MDWSKINFDELGYHCRSTKVEDVDFQCFTLGYQIETLLGIFYYYDIRRFEIKDIQILYAILNLNKLKSNGILKPKPGKLQEILGRLAREGKLQIDLPYYIVTEDENNIKMSGFYQELIEKGYQKDSISGWIAYNQKHSLLKMEYLPVQKSNLFTYMAHPCTTLCYIEQDGKYLMMHRIKKQKDINKDKWVGIGGHFENGESPEECLLREAKEETGLTLTSYKLRGIITFISDHLEGDAEYMFLYTASAFTGEILECDEGNLEWIAKEEVYNLPIWEGDKLFFHYLEEDRAFFSLKLRYIGNQLVEAVCDGKDVENFLSIKPHNISE